MSGDTNDCFAPGMGLLPVAEALARLRAAATPMTGTEEVPLEKASGRVLASAVASPRDVPAFDNVAVDGWAFAHADQGTGPTTLTIQEGRAAAGHPYPGQVPPGSALQALTGGLLPAGTDTVAMWEACTVLDQQVTIPAGHRRGAGRRRAGEDVKAGQLVLTPGLRLEARHLGVVAELGLASLEVRSRLRVALVSSGDEVIEPGQAFRPGAVYDANRPILRALLSALPCSVTDLGIVPDEPGLVREALDRAAASHDVILSSGGASKGEEDHLVRVVEAAGDLHFWQIAMKPGRPLALGRLGGAVFLGLPGNPVAATVCFLRFARPLLLGLAGAGWREPMAFPLPAAFDLDREPGRTELLRGKLARDGDGRLVVERIRREGSGILTSLTDADGLVEIGPEVERVRPGDPVLFSSFAELAWG